MTLRQSETVLRLLVGLALGFGFVGYATHSRSGLDLHSAQLVPSADLDADETAMNAPHTGF